MLYMELTPRPTSTFDYILILCLVAIGVLAVLFATSSPIGNIYGACCPPKNIRNFPLQISQNNLITGHREFKAINVKTGKISWEHGVGQRVDSISVSKEDIYTSIDHQVIVYDAATGKPRTLVRLPQHSYKTCKFSGPFVCNQGRYLVISTSTTVHCCNLKKGAHIWTSEFSKNKHSPRMSIYTLPENVYVNTLTNTACLDLFTGTEKWTLRNTQVLGKFSTATPVIIALNRASKNILGLCNKGRTLWFHPLPASDVSFHVTPSTTSGDDILVIWSCNGKAYLDSIKALSGKLNWRYGPVAGDVALYEYLCTYWRNSSQLYTSRPHVNETQAYFYCAKTHIHQVDLETGKGRPIASFRKMATSTHNSWLYGWLPRDHIDIGVPRTDMAIKGNILYLCSTIKDPWEQSYHAFHTKKRCLIWSQE